MGIRGRPCGSCRLTARRMLPPHHLGGAHKRGAPYSSRRALLPKPKSLRLPEEKGCVLARPGWAGEMGARLSPPAGLGLWEWVGQKKLVATPQARLLEWVGQRNRSWRGHVVLRQACPEESGSLLRQAQDERPLYRRAQHDRTEPVRPEPVLSQVEGPVEGRLPGRPVRCLPQVML